MDEAMAKSGDWPNVAVMAGTDPAEVMREHGQVIQNGEKHELADTREHSKAECPHSNVSQNLSDTRERLEADLNNLCLDCLGLGWNAANDLKKAIRKLLDRQDAITRRECADERENPLTEAIATCTKKISKLEAERDALKKQINRFNASKSEEIAENDTSKGVLNNFDVQNDTRERLEAWAHEEIAEKWAQSDREATMIMDDLLDLLDRQAAITERKCMKQATTRYIGWDCAECAEGLGKELDARCDPLKERIAELTAERDHFRKHVNHLMALIADIARKQPYTFDPEAPYTTLDTIGDYLDELHGDVASMRAERDQLREELRIEREAVEACEDCGEVVRLTAERDQLSRDLEAEHAMVVQFEHDNEKLRDTCNTLRASVAGLKMTVERFKARESREPADMGN